MEGALHIDLSAVDRSLRTLEDRAKRLAPAFRELRKPMRHDQGAHAKSEEGPSGKWPARSPLTEARRRKRNRSARTSKAMKTIALKKPRSRSTPKRILGKLPAAVIYTTGQLFIRARSRAPWAGAHQGGGRVGRHRRSRLPAREFLWISDSLLLATRTIIGGYIIKGWRK